MNTKILIGISCLFLSFNSLLSQERFDQRTMDVIDSLSTAMMANADMVGLAIGVVYENELAFTNTYGWAVENITPFTSSTRVRWASISKTLTGLLAMRLVEEGHLNLEDEIEDYISGWTNSGIKIKHLLAHQSGIGHYKDCLTSALGYPGPFVPNLSAPLVSNCSKCFYPPGSFQLYTTFGSTLLGVVIDHIANVEYSKSYVELFEDWVKSPLGLSNTNTDNWGTDPLMAKGYWGAQNPIPVHEQVGWKLPAGGFYSNIRDLARYAEGILNHEVVNSATSNTMWTIVPLSGTTGTLSECTESPETTSSYGLSFGIAGNSSNPRIYHNGVNGTSANTEMSLWPNKNLAIVLMTNTTENTNNLATLRTQIYNAVLCPSNRNFSNVVNWENPSVYESSNIIELSNTITRSNELILDADSEVIFKQGFFAPYGSSIQAVNEGCNSGPSSY